jgi:hypothetical protein
MAIKTNHLGDKFLIAKDFTLFASTLVAFGDKMEV